MKLKNDESIFERSQNDFSQLQKNKKEVSSLKSNSVDEASLLQKKINNLISQTNKIKDEIKNINSIKKQSIKKTKLEPVDQAGKVSKLQLQIKDNDSRVEELLKNANDLQVKINSYEIELENISVKVKNSETNLNKNKELFEKTKFNFKQIVDKEMVIITKIESIKKQIIKYEKKQSELSKNIKLITEFCQKFESLIFYNCKFVIEKNDEKSLKTLTFVKNSISDFKTGELYSASNYDLGLIAKIKRIKRGLQDLKKGNYKNPYLGMSFDRPLSIGKSRKIVNLRNLNLNASQQKAVEMAVNSTSISYLQGPPGTGKTQTISAIAQYEVSNNDSNVLVTSSTHEAINNFFDRLYKNSESNPNIIYLRMVPSENEHQKKESQKYSSEAMYSNFIEAIDKNVIGILNVDEIRDFLNFASKYQEADIAKFVYDPILNQKYDFATILPLLENLGINVDYHDLSEEEKISYAIDDLETHRSKMLRNKELKALFERFSNLIDSLVSSSKLDMKDLLNPVKTFNNLKKLTINDLMGFKKAITKLNEDFKKQKTTEEYYRKNEEFALKAIQEQKINVIGLTTTARQVIKVLGVEKELFIDYPIQFEVIDEVSKSTTVEITSTALLANKVLLAGDYRQLPPTNEITVNLIEEFVNFLNEQPDIREKNRLTADVEAIKELTNDLYGFSLFKEHALALRGINSKDKAYTNLKIQHRFNEQIMELVNLVYDEKEKLEMPEKPREFKDVKLKLKKVYDSKIMLVDTSLIDEDFAAEANRRINKGKKCKFEIKPLSTSFDQVITLDGTSRVNSRINEYNAFSIAKIVKNIAMNNTHINPNDIGIIAMTRSQVFFIKEALKSMNKTNTIAFDFNRIKIDTVDNFQGREKEIIIVDLVAAELKLSEDGSLLKSKKRNVEFYQKAERLNVAVSRAQSQLILVGAMSEYLAKNIITSVDTILNGVKITRDMYLFAEQTRLIKAKGGLIKLWEQE